MTLAKISNEVFFKKAFANAIVTKEFVQDIVGVDIDPEKSEIYLQFWFHKSFSQPIGYCLTVIGNH